MSLTTTRQALAAALKHSSYSVYAYPNETMIAPAVVIVPGSPYVNIVNSVTATANFQITLMVINNDNQAALVNLEKMIETVYKKLPDWVSVGDFSQPTNAEVGSTEYLTSDLVITQYITKE